MNSHSNENCPQVQLRLCTKQQQYAVPDTPLSVPVTVDPVSLNNLVNSLLSEVDTDHATLQFDFLVNGGEILRQPLVEHLQESGQVSLESLITLEYFEQTQPPRPHTSLAHDDWVSCVRAGGDLLVSGCYDSTVHVWSVDQGDHLLTIPGHSEPVKCIDILPPYAETDHSDVLQFVSGSMDQTALMWQYTRENKSIECTGVMRAHSKSVDCVKASCFGGSPLVATGSWDSDIHVFNASLASRHSVGSTIDDFCDNGGDVGDKRARKKRKTVKKAAALSPVTSLIDHKEAVSCLDWLSPGELVSCSWDHTVRVWDVESGGIKYQLTGNKAFFSLSCCSPDGSTDCAVLTASADRHVRLYDPRSREGSVVKMMFTSHSGWVSDVAWSSGGANQFVTCSHDMTVKQWDLRSPKVPLYDLKGHSDKVLSCDWSNAGYIISGGADNEVKIFSVQEK